jgi:protein TonB
VNLTTDLGEKLLLERTQPSYPKRALEAGLQGSVVLQALIGTDGVIRDLKLLSGPMLLGKAACEAVKQWRYKPFLLNGHLVEAQTLVTVDFKLPPQSPSVLSQ